MSSPALRVRGLGKRYRLGLTHAGSLSQVASRWTRRLRGLPPEESLVDGAGRGGENPAGDFWALREVDLEVHPGEVVGVIGRNGAGKSTLLKILSRITAPTTGTVEIAGRVGSLLEVGTGFHPELTGRENVYMNATLLGMSKREVDAKLDEIVEFAGVGPFLDTPVKRYSSGMKVRLGFAVAAHLEPEVLIVDEVLAVGDAEFQAKCLGKMQDVAGEGRTVLFVSHNMGAVGDLCGRCVVLDAGRAALSADTDEALTFYRDRFAAARPSAPVNDEWIQTAPPEVSADADGLTVTLRVNFKRAFHRVGLAIELVGPNGDRLARISPRSTGRDWTVETPGPQTVGVRLDGLRERLNPGRYTVNVVLSQVGVRELARFDGAAAFEPDGGGAVPPTSAGGRAPLRLPVRVASCPGSVADPFAAAAARPLPLAA